MLVPISWALILATAGIVFGYFLAPIPIIVIIVICLCCLAFLVYDSRNSVAEGGLAILFLGMAILLFLVPMIITAGGITLSSHWQAIQDSAVPVTNFSWSWLFRQ